MNFNRTQVAIAAAAALGIFSAGAVVPTMINGTIATNYGGSYTAEEVVVPTLPAGQATVTNSEGVTTEYGITIDLMTGGYVSDEAVAIRVEFSDGVIAIYTFHGTDQVEIGIVTPQYLMGDGGGSWTANGDELTITSDKGSVVVLGGANQIRAAAIQRAHRATVIREQAEREARELQQSLDNETFSDAVNRLGRDVCAAAEGLDYISTRTVSAAAGEVLQSFQWGADNLSRWNNMNNNVRWQRLRGAMTWQCNDVTMVMAEQDLNNSINGLFWYDTLFN